MTDENEQMASIHKRNNTMAWGGGSFLDLDNPDEIEVPLVDYAYCLAYTPRWRGQCQTAGGARPFYGVGEHCVRGAQQMLRYGLGPVNALAFLFHESDEVPFGDFPGPAKSIPEVRAVCDLAKRVGASIDRKFGIEAPDPRLIKRWDLRMLATERRDLLYVDGAPGWIPDEERGLLDGYEPFEEQIEPYAHPEIAAVTFIGLYSQLMRGNPI